MRTWRMHTYHQNECNTFEITRLDQNLEAKQYSYFNPYNSMLSYIFKNRLFSLISVIRNFITDKSTITIHHFSNIETMTLPGKLSILAGPKAISWKTKSSFLQNKSLKMKKQRIQDLAKTLPCNFELNSALHAQTSYSYSIKYHFFVVVVFDWLLCVLF